MRLVQDHAVYAGMVEAMDLAVGKVLARLDDLNLADNTLVIFTSDNGGLSTSEGWPTSNLPLRGGKGWLYEGGIREPFPVRWPKLWRLNRRFQNPSAALICSPPSLMSRRRHHPRIPATDGLSLVPLPSGQALPERSPVLALPALWQSGRCSGSGHQARRLGS